MYHATRIHVAVSLHGVLLHPFHILGLVQINDKLSHITHQNAFKTTPISVHLLTNMDDTVLVTEMFHGVFHNSLCILLVLFVAIMVVKHDGGAQHGALVVGRGPPVVLGRQVGCRVPDKRIIHLPCRRIEQIPALFGIKVAGFGIIGFITCSHGNITSGYFSRTIDTRIGAVAVARAFCPPQHAPWVVRPLIDGVKIIFGQLGVGG